MAPTLAPPPTPVAVPHGAAREQPGGETALLPALALTVGATGFEGQAAGADTAMVAAPGAEVDEEEPTTPRDYESRLHAPTSPPWAPRKPTRALWRPPPQHELVTEEEIRSAARRRKLCAE